MAHRDGLLEMESEEVTTVLVGHIHEEEVTLASLADDVLSGVLSWLLESDVAHAACSCQVIAWLPPCSLHTSLLL